ncbi:MAG TPA: M20/M25/M40 family metallo-hydrolase [Solirubrobacterales bacterium]|nr:M20/M25/M40 family metallo-hydrolase [Solirubrobacterales bacterium]
MNGRLHDRFVRLCEVPSPTGREREVADSVKAELRALGAEVAEDDAAGAARAGAGNLLARIPGRGGGWVGFCAHVDTVPHESRVEVVLDGGVYRSAGETILGADDKAAVAVLLELAARRAEHPGETGIELLLTVAEEDGLRGAKAFEAGRLRAERGFVLDHASPIGEVITAAPTYHRLTADFEGTEAHAGINPEDGHSAIAAAAAAVGAMRLGRLDEETTANVGVIDGGNAANVVPGRCRVEAEARSIDPARAAAVAGEMAQACGWGASEHGCDADVRLEELFRGYRVPRDSASLALAEAGLARAGYTPRRVATGGGSDANALVAKGLDWVLLANGTRDNHTPQESVAAANLDAMLAVCEAIAEETRRC